MVHPNIKSYREDRRGHMISPLSARPQFLGRNTLDLRWGHESPKVNLAKKEHHYEMEVTLPGFTKEDIHVDIDKEILTIRAERKEEKGSKEYVIKEFDYDAVERTFVLSDQLNKDKVSATYDNGILKITFDDVPTSREENKQKVVVK